MSIMKTLTINGVKYDVTPVVPATSVTLLERAWVDEGEGHSQVVEIPGVTPSTKVDLQPTAEQLVEFHDKILAFVAENNGGVVTVYAIGHRPTGDHTIQTTLTEVEGTGKIRGNTVGTTMPNPDWNQTDPTKADYIKNKPTYTAQNVGARPNTWLPTIVEIGAAPAGYGLGDSAPKVITGADALDSAMSNGWYYVTGLNFANLGGLICNEALMFVASKDRYHVRQILYPADTNTVIRREYHATGWTDFCCENPPMIPGVEYRTTERWNGKPVWTVSVDLGSHGPGMNYVETPFSAVSMIRHSGTVTNFSAPELYPTSEMNDLYANAIQAFVTNGYLGFRAIRGSSYDYAASFNAQAWYTKE